MIRGPSDRQPSDEVLQTIIIDELSLGEHEFDGVDHDAEDRAPVGGGRSHPPLSLPAQTPTLVARAEAPVTYAN